ncbi:MAG: bifunctional nuclease family protein [Chloroflexi bacterium AL-W]|nr:bifunctional nuclease family protein [Chloroflexi bacterium AL-N1]NOK68131.1 bifunctional nuclease family protein [Chloroflexi bacterium AL-N10]NOK73471.1 bifunctional nuclease family protein [Chloroflexi bacterium AL-N5]NOK83385.1 bifunctional nuclease family protein [Chloroflexi bacterium AL-W]NOK87802.1 bifunctional nuclease family protein [Chloroflexi bacterium AL-N15]
MVYVEFLFHVIVVVIGVYHGYIQPWFPEKGRPMIRVTVDSIRVSLLTQNRVVVLREVDSRRYLPIFIGPFEADAIAIALQGLEPQRPMTHDLLKTVFSELGASIRYILISDIRDSTFYARVVADQGSHTIEIDSRPSDAIALAVRTDVPIYVEPHVLEQGGTPLEEEEGETTLEPNVDDPEIETTEEGLSLFRDFINSLDIDKDEGQKDK